MSHSKDERMQRLSTRKFSIAAPRLSRFERRSTVSFLVCVCKSAMQIKFEQQTQFAIAQWMNVRSNYIIHALVSWLGNDKQWMNFGLGEYEYSVVWHIGYATVFRFEYFFYCYLMRENFRYVIVAHLVCIS